MHVDVLKMPHHGSDRNMEPIFFERDPRRPLRVFRRRRSTATPSARPSRCSLKTPTAMKTDLHLTYPIDEIDRERKKDWEKEQQKESARKKKNPAVEVREDWSDAENSLAAFFDLNPVIATKVRIVDAEDPHVIDLLDPVGI